MNKLIETPDGILLPKAGSTEVGYLLKSPPASLANRQEIDLGNLGGGGITSIQAGTNITIDNSNPSIPIISAAGGGGGGTTYTLSSDFTVNNTTTFAATGVEFNVDSNSLYVVDFYLYSTHEGATFARGKVTLGASSGASFSANASGVIIFHGWNTNLQAAQLVNGMPWPNTYQLGAGDRITGIMTVSVINGGVMQLMFAQQSAVAQNTILKAGSRIVVKKVM